MITGDVEDGKIEALNGDLSTRYKALEGQHQLVMPAGCAVDLARDRQSQH